MCGVIESQKQTARIKEDGDQTPLNPVIAIIVPCRVGGSDIYLAGVKNPGCATIRYAGSWLFDGVISIPGLDRIPAALELNGDSMPLSVGFSFRIISSMIGRTQDF